MFSLDGPNEPPRSFWIVLLMKNFFQHYFIVTSHEDVFAITNEVGALRGRNWSPVIVKKSYLSD